MTNQLANTLRSHGVKKGDRVVLYLPVMPITVAAMMACARIGAVHNIVFAGFSAEALASRIQDGMLFSGELKMSLWKYFCFAADADTVITADQGVRGGKIIPLKSVVDAAVAKCPGVKRVFVTKRTGNEVPMGTLDIPLDKVCR